MRVPAANISGVQPERRNVVAERSSHRVLGLRAVRAVTSKCTQECGFTKSIFVTTPEIVDVLVHREVAETVVRQRRRGHETRHGQAE